MQTSTTRPAPAIAVSHMDRSSRVGVAIWSALTLALILAPWWSDRSTLRLLTEVFSYICLASLWNLLAGYAGLVSVGQQAFVGLGGYVLYACALGLRINPLWGAPGALILSGALAVPIALVLFRLRGAYFAIGSWVIAEVFMQTAQLAPVIAGLNANLSLPAAVVKAVAANRDTREHLLYWLFLALLIFTLGIIVALLRSRYGLALTAIRDNELAAQANGVDVNRTRLTVFVVASAATGATGALIFLQKLSITPVSAFAMNDWTTNVIFMTVIGGIGRVEGPIVGALLFFLLRQLLADEGSIYLILLGVVAIGVMVRAKKGLWGYFADRFGWQLFPLARHLIYLPEADARAASKATALASAPKPGEAI